MKNKGYAIFLWGIGGGGGEANNVHCGRCSSGVMPIKMALKQKGVHFVLCQGNKIEGVVINRVCVLGIFLS